jgi:hypothetical protein
MLADRPVSFKLLKGIPYPQKRGQKPFGLGIALYTFPFGTSYDTV